jgi:trimethylamine--corrinoid protein Co-methyltransferase
MSVPNRQEEAHPVSLKILSEEEIQRIHDASLRILERTGVKFAGCPEAISVFRNNGCRVDGERVFFPKAIFEEYIHKVPDRNTVTFPVLSGAHPLGLGLKRGESHVGLVGNAYYLYDYEEGGSRDVTGSDREPKMIVLDSLSDIEFDFCLLLFERTGEMVTPAPQNPDEAIAFLRQWVLRRQGIATEHMSLFKLQPNCRESEVRLMLLGRAVLDGHAGISEELDRNRDNSFIWCNPISPLCYNPDEARGIIEVAQSKKRIRMIMNAPEVMMGATGPVTIAGTLVQHNCEVLAGVLLAQMASPGTPVLYGSVSAPMDLRTAEISQGNFETGLINAAVVQLADRYGLPSRIAPGNTSDRSPSARALAETVVGVYMGMAAGGNLITTGLLDSTLMISYEHLVLANELIRQLRSVTGGIRTDSESLAEEVIHRLGGASLDYLQSEHTLENMHRDIYYSLFRGRVKESYRDWYEMAHEKVKEILRTRSADRKPEGEVAERLRAVESRLREDPDTWRNGAHGWLGSYLGDFSK